MKLGPTGKFPGGKIDPTDEGELTLGVAYDKDKDLVHINFGTPVKWLALEPFKAMEFAKLIIDAANKGKQQ